MELLEAAGRILAAWIVCSLIVAAGWSCCMSTLRRKEQRAHAAMTVDSNKHSEHAA
jgi:hypothetical protein